MALALAITQMGCQAPPPTSRITVASAGRISSLDPAQASTLSATQLISALGDPLYRLCLLYTSPSPRDRQKSRMPSSA